MPTNPFYSKAEHSNAVIDSMIIGRNDKRDFIRMSIDSVVDFTRPGSNDAYSGKTVDLSATGLRFITKTPVKVGELLEITIKPGIAITPSLELTMAVVRVAETEDGQYDVAGVTKINNRE